MTNEAFQTLGVELGTVCGGLNFRAPLEWLTGVPSQPFKIPAADPPGHTALLRREWKQHPR